MTEIFCEECEYDLSPEELENANDTPKLGKEAFTNGEIWICANCYRNGYNDWISESLQEPMEDIYGNENPGEY